MISRRILRIKVLQVVYAHFQSGKDYAESEKELIHSVMKGNDLFYYFIQLLIELQTFHEQRIEIAKQKKIPTKHDLSPSLHFMNNAVIALLKENGQVQSKLDELRYSWVNYPALKKKLWTQVEGLPEFQTYQGKETVSFEDDKDIIKEIVRKVLSENDDIFNLLQEQSVYWNVEIEFVLSIVVKIIKTFSADMSVDTKFVNNEMIAEDLEFSKKLLCSTLNNYETHNLIIDKFTQNWELERIAFMDVLIMHLAINEVLEFSAIPKKVSMNEYIELAKFFSTSNSSHFINGVLDKVLWQYEQENKIKKQGRGLIDS